MSDERRDDFIIFNKCIYGIFQAVRQCYKKSVFVGGNIHTYLYVKKSKNEIVYVAWYVDDYLIIGAIEAINKALTDLKKGLVLKVVEGLQDYLSCEVSFLCYKIGHG